MSSPSTETPVFSHLDESGQVRMVDVSGKQTSERTAVAEGRIRMSPAAYQLLSSQKNAKGEVLNTARVAGVLPAKRCAELIPLCHSLPLSFAGIDFLPDDSTHSITITATCRSDYKTGVEKADMTTSSVADLTI